MLPPLERFMRFCIFTCDADTFAASAVRTRPPIADAAADGAGPSVRYRDLPAGSAADGDCGRCYNRARCTCRLSTTIRRRAASQVRDAVESQRRAESADSTDAGLHVDFGADSLPGVRQGGHIQLHCTTHKLHGTSRRAMIEQRCRHRRFDGGCCYRRLVCSIARTTSVLAAG